MGRKGGRGGRIRKKDLHNLHLPQEGGILGLAITTKYHLHAHAQLGQNHTKDSFFWFSSFAERNENRRSVFLDPLSLLYQRKK